jgi:hypothetical protein
MLDLNSTSNIPSNKIFGWFFSCVSVIFSLYSYWQEYIVIAIALAVISLLFIYATIFRPQTLTPINQIWYKFGIFLGKIISPIVLGIIFFAIITPISLITRLFGRDELKIKKISVQTYWINRISSGSQSDSFKNQY